MNSINVEVNKLSSPHHNCHPSSTALSTHLNLIISYRLKQKKSFEKYFMRKENEL